MMQRTIAVRKVTGGYVIHSFKPTDAKDAGEVEIVVNDAKLLKRLREILADTTSTGEMLQE